MKYITLLIAFSVLILSNSVNAQKTAFDPNSIRAEDFSQKGLEHGKEYDEKGVDYKVVNDKYSKGLKIKKDGKWLKHGAYYRYSSDYLSSKTTYSYGKKHGPYLGYYRNGQVQFQYSFKNDLKEGKWYQYRDDGSMVEERNYISNLYQGIKIAYFRNGAKQFVTQCVDSEKHGEQSQYNSSGKLVSKTQYKNGKSISSQSY